MEKNVNPNKKEPQSRAQINKNYIANLKKKNKYGEYKKKMAALMKKRREASKATEMLLSTTRRDRVIAERRKATRERVRKCRERKKKTGTQQNDPTEAINNSYTNLSTLGKAAKKVTKAFPISPRKQKAVLVKVINDFDEKTRRYLINVIQLPRNKREYVQNYELVDEIHAYLNRDDISRTSPKAKDVKHYPCPKTGKIIILPTKHMELTMKEAYAIFVEQQKKEKKQWCSLTFFCEHRPKNIKLIHDLPHDMCMCSYHSNFIEAVAALHKIVPNIPLYSDGFVQRFLCNDATKNCWFGRCDKCTGITNETLHREVGNIALDSEVSWVIWKKDSDRKRVEKCEEAGQLSDLITHITTISQQFLQHSFIKTAQSATFNMFDRTRASSYEFGDEGMLQVDFAENFVCQAQGEVQSAHWNQRQLSLFTTAFHYNESFQSKVFVSNSLVHTKETIVPYMFKLLTGLPQSLKVLKIWSDGPSSQFKNKFIAAMIPKLEEKFGLKIYWNYFATSHGKGCVDGIGATAKLIVRKHIRARYELVNCAVDFVRAFNRTKSQIIIEEVPQSEIDETNDALDTLHVFANAKNVRNIASSHQIQVVDGKIVTFDTSREGYI